MGCVPSCPTLEEGMFRGVAILELLPPPPPPPASSMGHSVTSVDSALQERIRINAESMARIKAMGHLNGKLVPNLASAFPVVDKEFAPTQPMSIPSFVDTRSSTECISVSCSDSHSRTSSDIRVLYSTTRSTTPGVGLSYFPSGSTDVDISPSSNNVDTSLSSNTNTAGLGISTPSSQSAGVMPWPRQNTTHHAIPQSISVIHIPSPLISPAITLPPRAMIRGERLTHSATSPVIIAHGRAATATSAALRPPPVGQYSMFPERSSRLARMREEALEIVEARGRAAIDAMISSLVQQEQGKKGEGQPVFLETSVWI